MVIFAFINKASTSGKHTNYNPDSLIIIVSSDFGEDHIASRTALFVGGFT